MRASQLLVSAVLLLAPLAGFAVPTGLNIMPTAEILGPGVSRMDLESEGSGKLFVPPGASLIGSQAGFILGFEGGADEVTGESLVYNLKWRFSNEGLIFPAMAVGVQNITNGHKAQYYFVGTKSLLPAKMVQVSAGALRDNNGKTLIMYGAEGRLGPAVAKVDHVDGGGLSRTGMGAGFDYRGFGLFGTVYATKDQPTETTVMLTYTQGIF